MIMPISNLQDDHLGFDGCKDFDVSKYVAVSKHVSVVNVRHVHAELEGCANFVTKDVVIANGGYVIVVGAIAAFVTADVGIAIAEIAIDVIATAEIGINAVKFPL